MDSSGVQYNAAVIVKLKKMYNNIRKYYELNMFRSFLMIDKYGKSMENQNASKSIDRNGRHQVESSVSRSQDRKLAASPDRSSIVALPAQMHYQQDS